MDAPGEHLVLAQHDLEADELCLVAVTRALDEVHLERAGARRRVDTLDEVLFVPPRAKERQVRRARDERRRDRDVGRVVCERETVRQCVRPRGAGRRGTDAPGLQGVNRPCPPLIPPSSSLSSPNTTAMAPCSCAKRTFCENGQRPRCTSATQGVDGSWTGAGMTGCALQPNASVGRTDSTGKRRPRRGSVRRCGPKDDGRDGWSELVRCEGGMRASASDLAARGGRKRTHLDVDAALAPTGQSTAVDARLARVALEVAQAEPVVFVEAEDAEDEVAERRRRRVELGADVGQRRVRRGGEGGRGRVGRLGGRGRRRRVVAALDGERQAFAGRFCCGADDLLALGPACAGEAHPEPLPRRVVVRQGRGRDVLGEAAVGLHAQASGLVVVLMGDCSVLRVVVGRGEDGGREEGERDEEEEDEGQSLAQLLGRRRHDVEALSCELFHSAR